MLWLRGRRGHGKKELITFENVLVKGVVGGSWEQALREHGNRRQRERWGFGTPLWRNEYDTFSVFSSYLYCFNNRAGLPSHILSLHAVHCHDTSS